MERVRKPEETATPRRVAQGRFTLKSRESEAVQNIDESPLMTAQRKRLQSLVGGDAIQRVEGEEDALQGKFETVQRQEEEEPLQGKFEAVQRVEEEEPLQGKFEGVQRVEDEEPLQGQFATAQRVEEEEPLQGRFDPVQRVDEEEPLQGKFEVASSVQLKEEAAKPNETGLPDKLKNGIESLSGMSMDGVKVHYNSSQPAQLNALAYAQGTDIHVAPGQEQHLPHEAWHVVQQAQGRVEPTMQLKEGVPVNDDKSLEHEADVMGARAVRASEDRDGLSKMQGGATQLFAVPGKLLVLSQDVGRVVEEIRGTNEDAELPGGNVWADETRSASLRKLNEWQAYKLALGAGAGLPRFGEDIVTEPDIGTKDSDGNWTNVVENKFVSGKKDRITENVKDAICQIKCSNRSPKYYGHLMARIELSDATREDLRMHGSAGGDTRMKAAWLDCLYYTCPNLIEKAHSITLYVVNLPERGTAWGVMEYQHQFTSGQ